MGTGRSPEPWAMLMIELMVDDFPRSLAFWTGPLGFRVAFERPGQDFACLQRPEGAQVMIYRRDGDWETGPMEPPFGRGAIIQVYVTDVDSVHRAALAAGATLYVDLREKWRDWGDRL
ncbi:MAG TPA: VOC family protein, partial [Rubellimicrobium sp.]|nr:VOC family protein [Rubellimicrobium sp.]